MVLRRVARPRLRKEMMRTFIGKVLLGAAVVTAVSTTAASAGTIVKHRGAARTTPSRVSDRVLPTAKAFQLAVPAHLALASFANPGECAY